MPRLSSVGQNLKKPKQEHHAEERNLELHNISDNLKSLDSIQCELSGIGITLQDIHNSVACIDSADLSTVEHVLTNIGRTLEDIDNSLGGIGSANLTIVEHYLERMNQHFADNMGEISSSLKSATSFVEDIKYGQQTMNENLESIADSAAKIADAFNSSKTSSKKSE